MSGSIAISNCLVTLTKVDTSVSGTALSSELFNINSIILLQLLINLETNTTMSYIDNAIDLSADVTRATEWFEKNFKQTESAEEGTRVCERYLAEMKALHDHYVTKVETYKNNCEYYTDKPRITVDNINYDWDGWADAYLGPTTPSGIYGAREEEDGKWRPAVYRPTEYDAELSFESFDTPHSAIKRSLAYFAKGTPI